MTLVFNASPVIVLAKAQLIDCIIPHGHRMIIPGPVAEEILRVEDPADAASNWLQNNGDLVKSCQNLPSPQMVAAWDLGAGESSVLTLAASISDGVAVLDDLAARRCGEALGVKVIGTIGLILLAKKEGKLESVTKALAAVVVAGLFISPSLVQQVIKAAGEDAT